MKKVIGLAEVFDTADWQSFLKFVEGRLLHEKPDTEVWFKQPSFERNPLYSGSPSIETYSWDEPLDEIVIIGTPISFHCRVECLQIKARIPKNREDPFNVPVRFICPREHCLSGDLFGRYIRGEASLSRIVIGVRPKNYTFESWG